MDNPMQISVPESLAQRLKAVAQQEGTTVSELLERLLSRYTPTGSLASMAQNALEAGLASDQPVDTASRSREILSTEYADLLKRRMTPDTEDDNHGQ